MSKYVIIHGQLREISDDELMHWKYVKRVKKNGRWVYYYDDQSGRYKESMDKAKTLNDRAKGIKNFNESLMNTTGRTVKVHLQNPNRDVTKTKKIFDAHDQAIEGYKKAVVTEARTHNNYMSAVKAYENQKVKDIGKKTIAKGVVKVANFFSKVFSKKK